MFSISGKWGGTGRGGEGRVGEGKEGWGMLGGTVGDVAGWEASVLGPGCGYQNRLARGGCIIHVQMGAIASENASEDAGVVYKAIVTSHR